MPVQHLLVCFFMALEGSRLILAKTAFTPGPLRKQRGRCGSRSQRPIAAGGGKLHVLRGALSSRSQLCCELRSRAVAGSSPTCDLKERCPGLKNEDVFGGGCQVGWHHQLVHRSLSCPGHSGTEEGQDLLLGLGQCRAPRQAFAIVFPCFSSENWPFSAFAWHFGGALV